MCRLVMPGLLAAVLAAGPAAAAAPEPPSDGFVIPSGPLAGLTVKRDDKGVLSVDLEGRRFTQVTAVVAPDGRRYLLCTTPHAAKSAAHLHALVAALPRSEVE